MGKRKKKIFFDVFGGLSGVVDATVQRSTGRAPPTRADGDVRLPFSMLGVLGFVFIVIVVVSYYFGATQGENRARKGDEKIALESNRDRGGNAARPESGGTDESEATNEPLRPFSVKALAKGYTRYTRSDLEKHMRECCRFLVDEGFAPVDLMDYKKDEKKGEGEFVLWVGRSVDKADSDRLAKRIRALTLKENFAFKTAFSAVFR